MFSFLKKQFWVEKPFECEGTVWIYVNCVTIWMVCLFVDSMDDLCDCLWLLSLLWATYVWLEGLGHIHLKVHTSVPHFSSSSLFSLDIKDVLHSSTHSPSFSRVLSLSVSLSLLYIHILYIHTVKILYCLSASLPLCLHSSFLHSYFLTWKLS